MEPIDVKMLPAYLPTDIPCPTLAPWTVHKALTGIRLTSTGGPDSITARFIREYSVELATPLTDIINLSFQQGRVPDDWKKSHCDPCPQD